MTNPVLNRTFGENSPGWAAPSTYTWGTSDGTGAPPIAASGFSIEGVAWKLLGLGIIAAITGGIAWQLAGVEVERNRAGDVVSFETAPILWPMIIVSMLAGFVLAIVAIRSERAARIAAPLYAAVEGVFLGGFSAYMEGLFPGIVFIAVLGTIGVALTCAVLFATGIIKVTEGFMQILMVAMTAILVTYLANFVMSLFGGPDFGWLNDSGPIGIVVSLVIIVVASMSLIADFHFITVRAALGAPKSAEWQAAVGLMVTLVWLYLEILRLLAKLRQ